MSFTGKLKLKIVSDYPDICDLGFFDQIKANLFGKKSEITLSENTCLGLVEQSAILVEYKGKLYFKCFGRLKDDV